MFRIMIVILIYYRHKAINLSISTMVKDVTPYSTIKFTHVLQERNVSANYCRILKIVQV
jgi:hypothetical protein